jgi:hypothetical protein
LILGKRELSPEVLLKIRQGTFFVVKKSHYSASDFVSRAVPIPDIYLFGNFLRA